MRGGGGGLFFFFFASSHRRHITPLHLDKGSKLGVIDQEFLLDIRTSGNHFQVLVSDILTGSLYYQRTLKERIKPPLTLVRTSACPFPRWLSGIKVLNRSRVPSMFLYSRNPSSDVCQKTRKKQRWKLQQEHFEEDLLQFQFIIKGSLPPFSYFTTKRLSSSTWLTVLMMLMEGQLWASWMWDCGGSRSCSVCPVQKLLHRDDFIENFRCLSWGDLKEIPGAYRELFSFFVDGRHMAVSTQPQ